MVAQTQKTLKKMKTSESLRMLALITISFFTLMIGGSIINYTLSVVFMETFKSIQCSCVWVIHTILIFILTFVKGSEMFNNN
jgi:hypothetical protein